ncbi:hypothetical protein ACTDI4_02490 [Mesorhizobium sp. PUT5]|uniref:hypothetical protein n=1 Tax=Mesorhizobium sp. PUT5 TaxID=3454629 RepID=UPI003FA42C1F
MKYPALPHLAISACMALSAPSFASGCENKDAIWSASTDKARYVIYGTDGLNMFSDVTLEQWRNQKLAWRTAGKVTCSNGVVVCYLALTNNLDAPDNGTSAIIEKIDENGDGVGDWVVFAGLDSELWYAGGAKVEWFNGYAPEDEDDRQTAPNIFRLDSCRSNTPPTSMVLAPNVTLPPITVGPVYADPAICKAFRRTNGFAPPVQNDGFWWMDDERVVGMEWECRITKRTAATLEMGCSGEGLTWNEVRPFRTGDGWVEIEGTRLDRCLK